MKVKVSKRQPLSGPKNTQTHTHREAPAPHTQRRGKRVKEEAERGRARAGGMAHQCMRVVCACQQARDNGGRLGKLIPSTYVYVHVLYSRSVNTV
jgi:hypothetical protein